jgi:hypothetical protein
MLAGFTGIVSAVRVYVGPPYERQLDEMDFDRR